jgi:lipoprotein-releasing system permease protein
MTQYTLASQIAFVHLMSRKKQTFIAALGVTFGISVFIAMIGMMNGINDLLEDLTLSATPHIHMYRDIQRREPSVMQRLLGNTPSSKNMEP